MTKALIVSLSLLAATAPASASDWNIANVKCTGTVTMGGADGKSLANVDVNETFSLQSVGGIDGLTMTPLRAATALSGPYQAQKTIALQDSELALKLTVRFVAPALAPEGLSVFVSLRHPVAGQPDELLSVGGATTPWRDVNATELRTEYTVFNAGLQQTLNASNAATNEDAAAAGLIPAKSFVSATIDCALAKDATEAAQPTSGIQLF